METRKKETLAKSFLNQDFARAERRYMSGKEYPFNLDSFSPTGRMHYNDPPIQNISHSLADLLDKLFWR